MMRSIKKTIGPLLTLCIFVAGCSQTILAEPLPTLMTIPSATPLPTMTATVVPTPTPTLYLTSTADFDVIWLKSIAYNVGYCSMEGEKLKMDIYFPDSNENTWPALVYLHGGAWISGDKGSDTGFLDRLALTQAGFLVASVNYRLGPKYKFPAMIEDVKCAVRYLRAHSRELNIDPNRIGAWGASAGGHLAALLGLTDTSAGWDVGEYLDQSSRVQAVVDINGPTDLNTTWFDANVDQGIALDVFGTADFSDPIFKLASPLNYVTPDAPPFFIIHGDSDKDVALEQSHLLFAYLMNVGVPADYLVVVNADHRLLPARGGDIIPSRSEITQQIVDFFIRWLK
jgi:acetyl esterase/lipase